MTMRQAERDALDPEKQRQRNPAFATVFPAWSEPLRNTDGDLARLARFLPREDAEPDAAYIARAEKLGMVVTLSSPEVKQNVRLMDERMREAGHAGVPLLLITDQAPDMRMNVPTAEQRTADEARKADLLDALRHPERARQEAEFLRRLEVEERLRTEHNVRVERQMELDADAAAREAAGLGEPS